MLTILLVEDDPIVQLVHRRGLENMHCKVDVAGQAQQALALAETNKYHIILMDVGLPEISGLEIASQLRKSSGLNAKTPIIALTAYAIDIIQENPLSAAVNEIVTKPIAFEALRQRLKHWYLTSQDLQDTQNAYWEPIDVVCV